MSELRPYQSELKKKLSESIRANQRVIAQLPTGGGKTVIIADITKDVIKNEKKTLILTHRREIAQQIYKKIYEHSGIISGQIISGKPYQPSYPCQVAMVGTLIHKIDKVPRPDLIQIDECHHAISPTWKKILDYWGDVPRLGFTATPHRLDGKGLGQDDLFRAIVYGPTIAELVKQKYLCYPVIHRPPNIINQNYHIKKGDFDTKEQEITLSSGTIMGDVLSHYKKHLNGLPTICFCPTVEHSKLTAEMFSNAGYVAKAVYGDMKDSDRDKALKGLADGSVNVITSCDVISEGLDVPGVVGAILLRRTLSLSLYLQQTGRALRPAKGKEFAVILDHAGNFQLHGHVLANREWSLQGERKRDKESTPKITECPRCYSVWDGVLDKCPGCGFEFSKEPSERERRQKEFKTIEGELIMEFPDLDSDLLNLAAKVKLKDDEANINKALFAQAHRLKKYGEEGRIKLEKLRKALGYSPRWTDIVWEKVNQNHKNG